MSTAAESTPAVPQRPPGIAWLSWAWVAVPFLYGLYQLVAKIPALFGT